MNKIFSGCFFYLIPELIFLNFPWFPKCFFLMRFYRSTFEVPTIVRVFSLFRAQGVTPITRSAIYYLNILRHVIFISRRSKRPLKDSIGILNNYGPGVRGTTARPVRSTQIIFVLLLGLLYAWLFSRIVHHLCATKLKISPDNSTSVIERGVTLSCPSHQGRNCKVCQNFLSKGG